MANLLQRFTDEILETPGLETSDYCHVSRGRSSSKVSVSISFLPSVRLHRCITQALRYKRRRGNLKFLSTLISQGELGAWENPSSWGYPYGSDGGCTHQPYFRGEDDECGETLSHPYASSSMYLEYMACSVVLAEIRNRLLKGQLPTT